MSRCAFVFDCKGAIAWSVSLLPPSRPASSMISVLLFDLTAVAVGGDGYVFDKTGCNDTLSGIPPVGIMKDNRKSPFLEVTMRPNSQLVLYQN